MTWYPKEIDISPTTKLTETELARIDGITEGTVAVSKAIVPTTGKHIDTIAIADGGLCLGAAGGIEAIATIKAIETGMLHPTINVDEPEEALAGVDYIPNAPKQKKITAALSNSFGFGGHNSTLVFAPYNP